MSKRTLLLAGGLCISLFAIFSGCDKKVGKLAGTAVTGCDTVTYNKHIKKIVNDYCISCHGDINPVGGFSLNSYAQVKVYADNGQLKGTIFDQVPELMPQGGPPLPQAQKDLITCWLGNGKKE